MHAEGDVPLPDEGFTSLATFVGVDTDAGGRDRELRRMAWRLDRWGQAVGPRNLYDAMHKRRLGW
jgi:hypothetical protein